MKKFVLLIALLVLLIPGVAQSEFFIDAYGGWSWTNDDDVTLTAPSAGFRGNKKVNFDDSLLIGGRVGYWIDPFPFVGIAIDISHFQPDPGATDISVVPFSGLVMLRLPLLKDATYEHGRLQPYIGAGPSLFYTDFNFDISQITNEPSPQFSDKSTDWGFDGRAGVAFMVHPNIAIFSEYRLTSFNSSYDDTIEGVNGNMEADYVTHHVAGGISFRF